MVLTEGQFRFFFNPQDFEKSDQFYRKGLELPLDHDWNFGPGDRGAVFHAGKGMVEILELAPGAAYVKPQGISMMIQVQDVDDWYKRAQDRKLAVIQEPATYPWGHRVLRLQDPDGIVVSLFHVVEQVH